MNTPSSPVLVSLTDPRPALQGGRVQGKPVRFETHGFIVRSLTPDDMNERILEWLANPEMMRGLNLGGLTFDLARLRSFVAGFDNRTHYFLGIFDGENVLVGFYTIDVNLTHKVGQLTAGIGERSGNGKKTFWATIDALMDHFYAERDIEKFSARVLASNYRMLFCFKDNSRFIMEARLQQECLAPDGSRVDILSFASFKGDGRKPVYESAYAGKE